MKKSRGKAVLIILAIILAIFAVLLSFSDDSTDISTTAKGESPQTDTGAGKVGVTITTPDIEDKSSEVSG